MTVSLFIFILFGVKQIVLRVCCRAALGHQSQPVGVGRERFGGARAGAERVERRSGVRVVAERRPGRGGAAARGRAGNGAGGPPPGRRPALVRRRRLQSRVALAQVYRQPRQRQLPRLVDLPLLLLQPAQVARLLLRTCSSAGQAWVFFYFLFV